MGKNRKIFLAPLILLFVFAAGFITSNFLSSVRAKSADQKYPLLAKRIQTDNPNDVRLDFRQLHNDIETDLQSFRYGDIDSSNVSIYFEYLPTGVSVNINSEMEVVAASLMKTAVAMQLYKSIERGAIRMDQEVTITEQMLDSRFGELYKSGAGASYTVRELLEKMLKESDNTASSAIKDLLAKNNSDVFELIDSLDLQDEIDAKGTYWISARSYSSIFKCLYFACFNSKADSQEILTYLSQTTSQDRMTNLLPDAAIVSHKIGTFNDEFQSDCGIVYAENGDANYLLCLMVRGDDPEASKVLARVSYKVYAYMNGL
jgi:beta-lactamase class A